MVRGSTVGFGKQYPEFWLNARPEMEPLPANNGSHICLRVRSTDLVDAFHAAALANGGTSNGRARPAAARAAEGLLRGVHPRP